MSHDGTIAEVYEVGADSGNGNNSGKRKDFTTDGADEPDWEADPDDDSRSVIVAVGRQIKLWRMSAGLSQPDLGVALGYGENQIYKVEAGKRIPRPEFLDKADELLGAGGKIAAMKVDVAEVRYPKKVRDVAKLEAEAVELGAYVNHNVSGLLQTEEYARALFDVRRPPFTPNVRERYVAARMARQEIFDRTPQATLTFVQEEATLRRPIGGRMVLRRQLEHLLERGRLRHVEIQVMPTDREDHAGMGGEIQVLKLRDGSAVAWTVGQLTTRVLSDPKDVQILEMRYGIIRSQALSPRESLAFIEKVLGET